MIFILSKILMRVIRHFFLLYSDSLDAIFMKLALLSVSLPDVCVTSDMSLILIVGFNFFFFVSTQ